MLSPKQMKENTDNTRGGEAEQKAILDALFFASNRPLHLDQLRRALQVNKRKDALEVLRAYVKEFNTFHEGIKISVTSKKIFVLHIMPEYIEIIRSYMRPSPLTKAQLMTLAFIYKHQPVELRNVVKTLGKRSYLDVRKLEKMRIVGKRREGGKAVVNVRDEAKYMINVKSAAENK